MAIHNTEIEPAYIWWSHIAGPRNYIASIEEMLSEGVPVISAISYSLPFRQEFRGEMCNRAQELGYMTHIIEDDLSNRPKDEDVGEALIHRFGQAGCLLSEYIRQKRNPRYLKKSGAFGGQLIWVKGLSKGRLERWIRFVSGFHSKGSTVNDTLDTAFIIEVIDNTLLPDRLPENTCRLNYADFIKEDDLHLFTSILVENRLSGDNSAVKRYVAELVTSICGTDSEVADAMVREEVVYTDVIELLQKIKSVQFSDSPRGLDDKSHPFSMLQGFQKTNLLRLVWIAQLRTSFPLIEQERLKIISILESEIECALQSEMIFDFDGGRILKPFDVEIGLLYKLTRMRNEDGLYRLYISDENVRDRIGLLRTCRNALAHMNTCDTVQFRELLSGKR